MIKKILAVLLILTIASSFTVSAENKILIISSNEELYAFAESVNSGKSYEGINIILNSDIYLNNNLLNSEGKVIIDNPVIWTPIGTEQNPFRGNFNGNGNSVYGIYVNNTGFFGGLFGVVANASITNIYVKDSYIKTNAHSGAVVGYAHSNSVISACYNSGSSVYTDERSGGIVGWTSCSDVYNCVNTGYIFSNRCSGGIVGDVYADGKIYNCKNAGVIDGGGGLAGGISGGTTNANIINCLNIGEIKSGYHMAGGPGSRNITNCFAYKNEGFNSQTNGDAALFESLSAELSEPLNIAGRNYTTVVDALNAFKDTMEAPVSLASWSQGNLCPMLNITVDRLSETAILSYDADTRSAIIYPIVDGRCIIFFASYDESRKLNKIDSVESTFASGIYADVPQKDISFTLGTGDKIMVWNNAATLSPVCEAFVIE